MQQTTAIDAEKQQVAAPNGVRQHAAVRSLTELALKPGAVPAGPANGIAQEVDGYVGGHDFSQVATLAAGGPAASALSCSASAGRSPFGGVCQARPTALVQTKLKVSQPNDKDEREADRVAREVVRPQYQTVQYPSLTARGASRTAENRSPAPSETPRHIPALNTSGRPLGAPEKTFMESQFDQNLDAVRVHTDPESAQLSAALGARAFTLGSDIVFGENEYRPHTSAGRFLLAHELTHVIQQSANTVDVLYRMTRSEEIRLSLTSPGRAAFQTSPPALSLYNFAIDRADPKEFHRDLLQEFARFVSREINIPVRIRVIGHASAPGTIPHNIGVAEQRTERVAAILRTEGLRNIDTYFAGESSPVANNDTVEGRSRNRRVDILLSTAAIPDPVPEWPQRDRPRDLPEVDFCDRYPLLCDLIPVLPIPLPIPLPWQLICLLAPELCLLIPCMINPSLCIPGPPDPPEPPDRTDDLPHVEFDRVRAANTPDAMGDRIPDQGSTAVRAEVTGYRPSMSPIQIEPLGMNPINGEFEINGGRSASITGSSTLMIGGTSQTAPAAAGFRLRLRARVGSSEVGRSHPFAVAAIMENMRTTLEEIVTDWTSPVAEERGAGIATRMSWDSDGADGLQSLDQMEYGEQLRVERESDGMAGMGLGRHGFLVWAHQEQVDYHGTEQARMRSVGQQIIMQVHTLVNYRTGETDEDIVVTNSGFRITREVAPDPDRPGCLEFSAAKFGTAGTAAGFRSGAGSGRAEATVPIPCDRDDGDGPTGPERVEDDGDGGTPSTMTLPQPHFGPVPAGSVPFFYAGGIPLGVTPLSPVVLIVSFAATSTDPARPERRVFRAPITCWVQNVTDTHVVLRTTNAIPLRLSPSDLSPVVIRPFKRIEVPFSIIRSHL